jgi:hypothetical protein
MQAPPPSAALTAFTSAVFDAARALEALHHALALADLALAELAQARLRAELADLERAFERLGTADLAEASVLAAHLRRRAWRALAAAPAQLHGVAAICALLDRVCTA